MCSQGVYVGIQGEGESLVVVSSFSFTRFFFVGRVVFFSMFGFLFRYSLGFSLRRGYEVGERVQSNEMGTFVFIMQFILRFLQLLCENYNRDLQVRLFSTFVFFRLFSQYGDFIFVIRLRIFVVCLLCGLDIIVMWLVIFLFLYVQDRGFRSVFFRWRCVTFIFFVFCRIFCVVRIIKLIIIWCARRCSFWILCAVVLRVVWGCQGFILTRITWGWLFRFWRFLSSIVRVFVTRIR